MNGPAQTELIPPKAIIVAAGASTRLRPLTDSTPKCLLPVAGLPMIHRIVAHLRDAGIEEIAVVVGYRGGMIREYLKRHFPYSRTRFCVNPKFESTNNAFSLLMAREFFLEEEKRGAPLRQLLLLDSDLVFTEALLPRMLADRTENRIGVRVDGPHDEEEVAVQVSADGVITAIGKHLSPQLTMGESIGVEYFTPPTARRLFETLERRVRQGAGRTEFYEASFQELIDAGERFAAVDLRGCPVAEVDTPADLVAAGALFVSH